MSWDGLIAGAIRGGAEAAGQIADGNIRLRDEEAAFTRQQAATRANADYSSKISIERFNMEADRRLADAPKAAAAKIEEEKKSRLSQVAEVDSAQQGLAQQAITKKASAARGSAVAYEDLTPEEISKLGLTDGETSKLRTQAARNVGLISEKDMMTSEQRAEMAQLRAEVQNARTEAQRETAQNRLQNALAIAVMRGAGNGASEKDKRNEILLNERKAIEGSNNSLQRRIREMNEEAKEASWLAKDTPRMTPEQKEQARDWRSEKARLQARLTANESQLDEVSAAMRELFGAQNEKHGGPSRASSAPSSSNGSAKASGVERSSAAPLASLPAGAKLIGTAAGGRPVYETPDGRRFIAQGDGLGGGK
jgi:hypothetical protein